MTSSCVHANGLWISPSATASELCWCTVPHSCAESMCGVHGCVFMTCRLLASTTSWRTAARTQSLSCLPARPGSTMSLAAHGSGQRTTLQPCQVSCSGIWQPQASGCAVECAGLMRHECATGGCARLRPTSSSSSCRAVPLVSALLVALFVYCTSSVSGCHVVECSTACRVCVLSCRLQGAPLL